MLTLLALLGVIGGSASVDDAVVCVSAEGLPLCSGVVIAPRVVLTAGHCIAPLGENVRYYVNFGADCRQPTHRLPVGQMLAHPRYAGEGKPFDIGVVTLGADAPPPPLALSKAPVDELLVGRTIRHVGYGNSQESPSEGFGVRRTVSHAVLSVDDAFVWSGDAAANTCVGDSGGPLLLDEQVLGVVSDGPDCHSASADQRLDVARAWVDAQLPQPVEKAGCAAAPAAAWPLALLAVCRAKRKRHPGAGAVS